MSNGKGSIIYITGRTGIGSICGSTLGDVMCHEPLADA